MSRLTLQVVLTLISVLVTHTAGIALDVEDNESVLAAAALTARNVVSLYTSNLPNGTVGKWQFPPYYWWESGGAWGGLMEYWHYTNDNQFNELLQQGIIAQLGPRNDFVVPAESSDTGNDDQGFWLFVAMAAAEYSFPQLPAPHPSWQEIAVNGWSDYVSRWNNTGCNGGLKWHFNPLNAGFYYKNSVSNGAFFQLSARLARFTGNETYVLWADTVWNWVTRIGLVDNIYNVYDGTDELINCTGIDHHQWSYNVGTFLYGAAMLQNYTNGSSTWIGRTAGLLDAVNTFVSPYHNASNVLFEAACETVDACNTDQLSMKAYTIRWLAATAKMAPFTAGRIGDILRASARGAAAACDGGPGGNSCGSKWYLGTSDGTTGLGQDLSAMEAMYALLVNSTNPPAIYPNVNIVPAPPSPTIAPSATSALPPTSDTARPLHDGALKFATSATNKIRPLVAAVLSTLAAVL